MTLNVRFDTKNNVENINGKEILLGKNFINFISLKMENILNKDTISNLSESNYKEILSKITVATAGIIIPEIIYIDVLIEKSSKTINIQQIKKGLTEVLRVYNKFKELTEFCYFNEGSKDMTPFQLYIYYLYKFKIEETILPKQIINSFGLNPKKASKKLLEDNEILVMLQKNSPFFCFCYQCLTIDDYMTTCFLKLIENNYLILKCENCGKYFIAYNRANTLYCDRSSPQDSSKNCKQYGKERKWLERTKDENDWYSLYRKVYQTFQKKAIRNPGHKESKQAFDNFRIEANSWKKAVKEGTKTEAEFMYWLQEFRKKK